PQYGQPKYNQPPYSQPQYGYNQPPYAQPPYGAQPGAPMSLRPAGVAEPIEEDIEAPDGVPASPPASNYSPRPRSSPAADPGPPLGPVRDPTVMAGGSVEVKPAATLACPIVSALDEWINGSVQPAAMRWFRQPVVEIKQISAYSCRGMNGNPNAHIPNTPS